MVGALGQHPCLCSGVCAGPASAGLNDQSPGHLGRAVVRTWGWGWHSGLGLVDDEAVFLGQPKPASWPVPWRCWSHRSGRAAPAAHDPHSCCGCVSRSSAGETSGSAHRSPSRASHRVSWPQGVPPPSDTAPPGGSLGSSHAHPPAFLAALGGRPGTCSDPFGE